MEKKRAAKMKVASRGEEFRVLYYQFRLFKSEVDNDGLGLNAQVGLAFHEDHIFHPISSGGGGGGGVTSYIWHSADVRAE